MSGSHCPGNPPNHHFHPAALVVPSTSPAGGFPEALVAQRRCQFGDALIQFHDPSLLDVEDRHWDERVPVE